MKAVGRELNPITPELFRHEALVLTHLGTNPWWAELLAVYDEPDGWVALILEDVPGRHPDMTNPVDVERVLMSTDALAMELHGRADSLDITTSAEGIRRWSELWPAIGDVPSDVLPTWFCDRADDLRHRHDELTDAATGDSVVQGDIRNDNLLMREDGAVVFVDWGMAQRGPSWVDPLLVRLEWVEQSIFDHLVDTSPALSELGDDHVTAFLVAVGGWLAYRITVAEDIGLPTLNEFRRTESARLLEGARRRLGIE